MNTEPFDKNKEEYIKYYCAFSFLSARPLFKAKLFEYFDYDIKRAFLADKNEIEKFCADCDINYSKNFLENKAKLNIDKCYKECFSNKNIKILTYDNEIYPQYLKEIPDFPLALFYVGEITKEDFDFPLAIVGSRKASQDAKNSLYRIISGLKESNVTIISGLAYGVDASAHQSAINNNIKTLAVIGSGLKYTYPIQNKQLYQDIINANGAILTEYPYNMRPLSYNFPQRNRIVVGMAKGTLVAEAQIKSGAMISANLALDYNRELMCIPGNILNPNTEGVYKLIKNGAGIVTETKDLLNNLGWDIILKEADCNLNLNQIQTKILNSLSLEAKTFDEIVIDAKEEISDIMVALTELELKNLIKQSENKYYKS